MRSRTEQPLAFAELGIKEPLLAGLRALGFDTPTEIQREMIPAVLAGRDVIGQARTGTGKTLAFALPALQCLDVGVPVQVLCLVPTRELAVQVVEEVRRLAQATQLRAEPVYGGTRLKSQATRIKAGPEFVVGTPGRTMDLMGRGILSLDNIRVVILDEVDRMLDIGFREDIRRILRSIHTRHQTIFVSATIDEQIRRLTRQFTTMPLEINVSQDELTVDKIDQCFITVDAHDKLRLLKMLLEQEHIEQAIVFTNTKRQADKLTARLNKAGISAAEIHSDLQQNRREKVMEEFRGGRLKLLVATDLAARGIDVEGITHIINYDIPEYNEMYVHRIGRTARMGRQGRAITFVTREEGKQLTAIEMFINRLIPEMKVEGFVPSPPRDRFDGQATSRVTTAASSASTPVAPTPATPFAAPTDNGGYSAMPRTLGGRFKPMRRRRR